MGTHDVKGQRRVTEIQALGGSYAPILDCVLGRLRYVEENQDKGNDMSWITTSVICENSYLKGFGAKQGLTDGLYKFDIFILHMYTLPRRVKGSNFIRTLLLGLHASLSRTYEDS